MGEIAEMMLNGDLDCETGEWIGGGMGFPRTRNRPQPRQPGKRSQPQTNDGFIDSDGRPIAPRAIGWLRVAAGGSPMYEGCNIDHAPAMFNRLERCGYVQSYEPHNPAHKTKVKATEKGRELLARGPVRS
jgi:hypothetical protein